ncbi:hypothetical protein LIER_18435 [Lithospermum erythrorhizon]|uniref:Uncharacterized protein n=1 Tax=Lithospermum erythrorhizon TaxID=34254 RepID=A0AAV3QIG0_LITER
MTSYVFTLGGSVVSWRATLQSTVTLSTTEAEYMALTEAAKEGIWLAVELPVARQHLRQSHVCNSSASGTLCTSGTSVHYLSTSGTVSTSGASLGGNCFSGCLTSEKNSSQGGYFLEMP